MNKATARVQARITALKDIRDSMFTGGKNPRLTNPCALSIGHIDNSETRKLNKELQFA